MREVPKSNGRSPGQKEGLGANETSGLVMASHVFQIFSR